MMPDHLDSAYATLGLSHDASPSAVKRQYRVLVRKWHPDRFTGDAQGIAEATLRLKALNHAYSTILEQRSSHAFTREPNSDSSPQSRPSGAFDGHLTQTQTDDIVTAIRHSESLLADIAGWRSRAASLTLATVYAAAAWNCQRRLKI